MKTVRTIITVLLLSLAVLSTKPAACATATATKESWSLGQLGTLISNYPLSAVSIALSALTVPAVIADYCQLKNVRTPFRLKNLKRYVNDLVAYPRGKAHRSKARRVLRTFVTTMMYVDGLYGCGLAAYGAKKLFDWRYRGISLTA